MSVRLAGKRVILTGGVANIGLEVVHAFVAEQARVTVGDLNVEAGKTLAAEFGAAVEFCTVDVTHEDSVRDLIASAVDWLGGLDVLVQNASLQHSGAVMTFDTAHWDALFAVNMRAHFFGAKYAVPHLRAAGKGSIVNTSSLAGKRGGPGMTAYSASKDAVIAFGTALAMELAGDNIRVNTVCPGRVDTPFNQSAIDFMGGTGRAGARGAAGCAAGNRTSLRLSRFGRLVLHDCAGHRNRWWRR